MAVADSFLNPYQLGARMRLQIGFTLATVFLALFTIALWKQRSQKADGEKPKRLEEEEPAEEQAAAARSEPTPAAA